MADIGVLELCGIGAAISAGVGGPVALIRWVGGFVERSIADAVAAQEARVSPAIEYLKHKTANAVTRIDALEHLRVGDIERIVRIETAHEAIKAGLARVEHSLDNMKSDQAAGRAEIIETIREISKRELR